LPAGGAWLGSVHAQAASPSKKSMAMIWGGKDKVFERIFLGIDIFDLFLKEGFYFSPGNWNYHFWRRIFFRILKVN